MTNEADALRLASYIPNTFPHEVRQLGNGEYIIAILHHGKIAFIVWDAGDISRIPTTLRSKFYDTNH